MISQHETIPLGPITRSQYNYARLTTYMQNREQQMKRIIAGVLLFAGATLAHAQNSLGLHLTQNDIYVGGGIGHNQLSGWGDANGIQLFAGADLMKVGHLTLGAEAGYMSSGDFSGTVTVLGVSQSAKTNAKGFWANGVARAAVAPDIDLIGRVGYDFGDDDGVMLGAGVGYTLNRQMQIRGEYVMRSHINSLQANFVFYLM